MNRARSSTWWRRHESCMRLSSHRAPERSYAKEASGAARRPAAAAAGERGLGGDAANRSHRSSNANPEASNRLPNAAPTNAASSPNNNAAATPATPERERRSEETPNPSPNRLPSPAERRAAASSRNDSNSSDGCGFSEKSFKYDN